MNFAISATRQKPQQRRALTWAPTVVPTIASTRISEIWLDRQCIENNPNIISTACVTFPVVCFSMNRLNSDSRNIRPGTNSCAKLSRQYSMLLLLVGGALPEADLLAGSKLRRTSYKGKNIQTGRKSYNEVH